ncbi:putative NAD(P)/FAD-binding protein YdhS/tetratricopeptide (TPR) repeat protein [Streptacidiphilus sp. MAP12-16]|uniref:FAD/NAD(P)-binding protein n=1 Tax=Streptacidiphilus sp. MAP12-16 TaxID=3156300 RepID=UPI003512457E
MGIESAHCVAIVGAGAAGTLTAARLLEHADRRRLSLDVWLVDPARAAGRGVAYGTEAGTHLVNVPAGGMSAYRERPDHFVRWLGGAGHAEAGADAFVPRSWFGHYLSDVLDEAARTSDTGRLRRGHERVVRVAREGAGIVLSFPSGRTLRADGAVLALGNFPANCAWAPLGLREAPGFVADPWAAGAFADVPPDADVLLVGTGLTMVDVALALELPGRTLHAVSRHGLTPQVHARTPTASMPGPPLPVDCDLTRLRRLVRHQIARSRRLFGDWRPGVDSLRPLTAALWQQLSDADRARLLREDLRDWEVHRHRMPPSSADALDAAVAAGRLRIGPGEVADVTAHDDRIRVRLADGRLLTVGAVVNCTGSPADLRTVDDPLVADLLACGLARPGPAGLGLDTAPDGSVVASGSVQGRTRAPLWTLGALRRGNLLETTAVPEISAQAQAVAKAVVGSLERTRRRAVAHPRDPYGLRLSTTHEAAGLYNRGLRRVLALRSGAEDLLAQAVAADPGFAVAHATLALLAREGAAGSDVDRSLRAARRALAARRADERERSYVACVDARISAPAERGAAALLGHIAQFPRDALAVSVAVPTISFDGVVRGCGTWALVESLAPAYGQDWWYLGQLAFVRQEQRRWQEADSLAVRALDAQPTAGHAVHARAHVFYETGEHRAGLEWLDGWIARNAPGCNQGAHFSWHAALHELMLDDQPALARRYREQLAPPQVTGARALVDSASLLWRCRMAGRWSGPLPVDRVLEAVPAGWLDKPATGFTAMHAALALAAAGDPDRLGSLGRRAQDDDRPEFAEVIAPMCEALAAVTERRWQEAGRLLELVTPRLAALGGSAAQHEVIEETWLYALIAAGQHHRAAALLSSRLDRRPSPLDRRRLRELADGNRRL